MTKILTFKILLSIFLLLGFSPTKKKIYTTYADLDKAFNADAISWEFKTNKIVFLNSSSLDTVTSKPFLDSLVWFLNKHKQTAVDIWVEKADVSGYRFSDDGNRQEMQIKTYIAKKIFSLRIVAVYFDADEAVFHDTLNVRRKKKLSNTIEMHVLIHNNYLDADAVANVPAKTSKPKCFSINNKQFDTSYAQIHTLLLNNKSYIGVSKSSVFNLFGKPTTELKIKSDPLHFEWVYYPKYCDVNSYNGSYLTFQFFNDTVASIY